MLHLEYGWARSIASPEVCCAGCRAREVHCICAPCELQRFAKLWNTIRHVLNLRGISRSELAGDRAVRTYQGEVLAVRAQFEICVQPGSGCAAIFFGSE